MLFNWGDALLASVCLGNSGVCVWQHPPGKCSYMHSMVSWHCFASIPTLPMALGLTQVQCIDLRDWKVKNGNQEFRIVAGFARNNSQMISKLFHTTGCSSLETQKEDIDLERITLWGEEWVFIGLVTFFLLILTEKNLSTITRKQVGQNLFMADI